jgi:hypothetical protein
MPGVDMTYVEPMQNPVRKVILLRKKAIGLLAVLRDPMSMWILLIGEGRDIVSAL